MKTGLNMVWILLGICASTMHTTHATHKRIHQKIPQVAWMNVYLHGGGMHPRYYSVRDFMKTLQRKEKNSVYAQVTRMIRHDPIFYMAQPIQEIGLHKAFPVAFDQKRAAHIFTRLYHKITESLDPNWPLTVHYTFGWNGFLGIRDRRRAAQLLCYELEQELKNFEKIGSKPKIRLFGYSHGGNVCLSLGEIFLDRAQTPFVVDELILISTPVQEASYHQLQNPVFKKVWLFYSKGDYVQPTDFLSSHTHSFPHRTFLNHGKFKVPDKLTQVQIRIMQNELVVTDKHGKKHTFIRKHYINPGHTEMMFFGWTADWYRKFFPLNPLPTGLTIPVIAHEITTHHLEGKNLRATLVPDHENMILTDTKTGTSTTAPFLTRTQLMNLKQEAWQYAPENYKKTLHQQIKVVLQKARAHFKKQQSQTKSARKTCTMPGHTRVATKVKSRPSAVVVPVKKEPLYRS